MSLTLRRQYLYLILYIKDSYFRYYTFQLLKFSYLIGSDLKNTQLAKRKKIREKKKKRKQKKKKNREKKKKSTEKIMHFSYIKVRWRKKESVIYLEKQKLNWLNISMITKNRQIKVCLWAIKKFLLLISEKWAVKYKQFDKFYHRSTVTSYTSIFSKLMSWRATSRCFWEEQISIPNCLKVKF